MIGLIVAFTNNRVIGNNGMIPWRIKGEQQRFKELTTGNVVVMGRRSYEEIGRPLPNRDTIVVSNTKKFEADNLITVGSLKAAIDTAKERFPGKNIYISGGAGLYKEAMDLVEVMYITKIDAVIEGDTLFPEFDENEFDCELYRHVSKEETGSYSFDYLTYTRKTAKLDSLFNFFREIDKEKMIGRQTYLTGAVRKENDAEHAWHMSVMTLLLAGYANEKIDVLKTISMLLIHDLVEIYAGDTYAYDEKAKKSQNDREKAAADKLYSLLPKEHAEYLRGLWEEFELWESPEAKFAHTMDNIQPLMLNAANNGKSWVENGIALSQVLKRNERCAEGSDELWNYAYENFIKPNVEKGNLKNE